MNKLRLLLSLGLLSGAALTARYALSEEPASTPVARPIEIVDVTLTPKGASVGQEISVTARVRNTTERVLLANIRVRASARFAIVVPDVEQILFLEAGVSRLVEWRARIVSEESGNVVVEPSVISEGRPLVGTAPRVAGPAEAAMKRTWAGRWTTPRGFVYDAELRVRLDPSGAVEGRIDWTLVQASPDREDYVGKTGSKGVEYVWGVFDPATRNLDLEGYRRDDPRQILGIDRYRLTLAEDLGRMQGWSRDFGTWTATFELRPK